MKCFKLQNFQGFKSTYSFNSIKKSITEREILNTLTQNSLDGEIHVDGDALQKLWFPIDKKYDVFLSHAHNDEKLARNIAAELKGMFGIECFIDSDVWNCFKDIVNIFSERFPDKEMYGIITDAHLLLTEALFRVIINTEYFFFLETKNSIDFQNNRVTYSPWIFLELSLAKQLREFSRHEMM